MRDRDKPPLRMQATGQTPVIYSFQSPFTYARQGQTPFTYQHQTQVPYTFATGSSTQLRIKVDNHTYMQRTHTTIMGQQELLIQFIL